MKRLFSIKKLSVGIAFLISYIFLARLGLLLATINQSSSPVWPASGFAIAFLIVFELKYWPLVALGAFISNLNANTTILTSFSIAAGNAVEASLGCIAFSYFKNSVKTFEFFNESIAVFCSSLIGASISAGVGVFSLIAFSSLDTSLALTVFITWWTGNFLGNIVVIPLVVHFYQAISEKNFFVTTKKTIISLSILLLTVFLCSSIFIYSNKISTIFLIFPIILLGVSFAKPIISYFQVFIIAIVSVVITLKGLGPFQQGSINQNLIYLQLFLSAISISTIFLNGFRFSGPLTLPSVILVIGWSLSAWLSTNFQASEEETDKVNFEKYVGDTQNAIRQRLQTYEDALRSGVALFQASKEIDADEWKAFAESMQLPQRYPGINGIGVIFDVETANLQSFLKEMKIKNNLSLEIKTVPFSQQNPSYIPNSHFIITFIEPLSANIPALGLDIASEKNRRIAAEEARRSGLPTITEKIILVQDNHKTPGFLFLLPILKNEDPHAATSKFLGWVYAPFIAEKLFDAVLNESHNYLEVQIFDGELLKDENLIYSSFKDTKSHLSKSTLLEIGQRTYTIQWKPSKNFPSSHDTTIAWVTACSSLVTLLFAGLVASLQSVKIRAIHIANQKTKLLEESQNRFERTVSGSRDGSWELNQKTGELYLSPRWIELLGLSEDFIPKLENWTSRIHPSDMAFVRKQFEVIRAQEDPTFDVEYRMLHNNGNYRWFLIRGIQLFDSEGKTEYLSGSLTDITDRKKIEQELIEAREGAIASSKIKSEFLAQMSHEIRTPINAIMGMTSLVLESNLDDEQRENLNTVHHSADGLLAIVNDILDVSKIEAGKLDFEYIGFDLKNTIEAICKSMELLADKKNLNLEVNFKDSIPELLVGDPVRLRQILINLLSNAIKFTEQGFIKLSVSCLSSDKNSYLIGFEVKDSGIGISPDAIKRLFRPFMQADSSTTRRFGGTGLGLSICKHLVEKMEGKIRVSSEENVGTTFTVEIPFLTVEEGTKFAKIENDSDVVKAKRDARILVVDDNPVNQKYALKILQKMGYTPFAAEDGIEALKSLRENDYDLVLMDCQMPGMDGFETTRRIRKSKILSKRDITIVAITANASEDDRKKCLESGMDDYISKPFKPNKLSQILAKWIT